MKKERFEAITDAVLAIIITIMVLEIKLPEISVANLPDILKHLGIYALSFSLIAITWLNHHHIFKNAGEIPLNVVWTNFGMLFFASLIPMASEKLSEELLNPMNHLFYGAVFGLACLFYARLQQMMSKYVNYQNIAFISKLNWGSTVLSFLAIPLSFVSVYISLAIFILFPVFYFIVSRKGM